MSRLSKRIPSLCLSCISCPSRVEVASVFFRCDVTDKMNAGKAET